MKLNHYFIKPLMTVFAVFTWQTAVADNNITATWPFDAGSSNVTTATVVPDSVISYTSFELGSNLTYKSGEEVRKMGNYTFSELSPKVATSNQPSAESGDFINFRIVPKKGILFTPTKVTFVAAKMGTGGGTIDLKYGIEGADTLVLATKQNPKRNNDFTEYSFDIAGAEASAKPFYLHLGIYNLATTKAVAISSIVIEGTYSGTVIPVSKYTLTTSLSDAAAGTITVNPTGGTYDEDTQIRVAASENFGYHFRMWQNEKGDSVTNENPYTFNIKANTNLVAVYSHVNTYALNLSLTNGANSNLVTIEPTGTLINGVYNYEEGTEIKLTAVNNKILTFTNWEDNSTNMERSITMNQAQNITANFSAADYIVGWDLYQEQPTSARPADYKSESDNAGMLSLRKADGTTKGWMAGINRNRHCAINWGNIADHWYYEISFSSKGYKGLKLSVSMGDDYNSYSRQLIQTSVDDKTFTTVDTLELPNRAFIDMNDLALPTQLNEQDKVYIRFYPDTASAKTGVTSNNDGTMITDIFVTAEKLSVNDSIAPKLVTSIPSEGATGISATGSIILTFDEKVQAGNSDATLDGETLKSIFSGKTVVFSYNGLKYNTPYTFHLPAGAVTDRNCNAFGGVDISFTTMERTQPAARLYDAVVAQDGSGDYATIQSAINAVPNGLIKPYLIFVKSGTYKEHVDIPEAKPYIHLIGQGYDKVFISDNRLCGGDNAYSVDKGATVVARPANLYFEGISFVNSWGKEKNAGPQALALYTVNDRVILKNCGLYSYQDTWLTAYTVNRRQYATHCWIEGAVDFIYGQGNILIENSKINIVRTSGGYIVAPNHDAATTWGYVFLNDTITAPGEPSKTSVWLGRPWHGSPKTVYINTVAEVTIPAEGWYPTMGGLPSIWADYNTMDAKGNPVDLSNRRDTYYYISGGDTIWGKAKNHLTPEEAVQYTVKNVLSGDDLWQPTLITEACEAPSAIANIGKITWNAVPYAICYVIEKNDSVIAFTTSTSYDCDASSTYKILAVNEYGGLSTPCTVNVATGISTTPAAVQKTTIKTIYGIDGRRYSSVQPGINIVRYVDEKGKIIIKKIIIK